MKLNIGAGNIIMKGYINHDFVKHRSKIDMCFDLNEKIWKNESWWAMNVNSFDEIRAWDVIEHLNDTINFMDNCWSLLKKGGILHMKACGWQNPNVHIDITHKRPGFDIRSFDYFDPSTDIGKEYGYYTEKRWKIIEKQYDRKLNVIIKLTPRGK